MDIQYVTISNIIDVSIVSPIPLEWTLHESKKKISFFV